MSKNQLHGKIFEKDFLHKFYKLDLDYINSISNTSVFDCPIGKITENTSVKSTKTDCICLGDVNRIFNYIDNINNNEKIKLYILKYQQKGVFKVLQYIYEIDFNMDFHKELFNNISYDKIKSADDLIKNIPEGRTSNECKKNYKEKCSELSKNGKIKYNPKVDSKKQRRLQCSFDITKINSKLYNLYPIEEFNTKYNIKLCDTIKSPPRKFN
jgi:hypothetical protein